MGDEGVGVHAVRAMQNQSFPQDVQIVDGGTGGFHLLSYFQECSSLILIDATMDGRPPGTLQVLHPRFASDFPRALSAHDIGLRDLVESATLLGQLPKTVLVTISIDHPCQLQTELTPPVERSIPEVASVVRQIIAGEFSKHSSCNFPRPALIE